MARDALERTINVKVKGTWRKMTVRKAALRRLADKAVAGDIRALEYLLSLESEQHQPRPDLPESERSAAKDLAILQDFFDRRHASLPQHKQEDGPHRGPDRSEREDK
jgi:hypothetical protein